MWDASRSDPGALSERQRRPQQVLPERCSSVISEALAARASAQKQTDDSHLIGSLLVRRAISAMRAIHAVV
ncbi:MAG TPA: hypothetical protein VJ251_04645, partial [Stellaceae bacterium]|nr:hypothetical protein [Stellaceae bacterium]